MGMLEKFVSLLHHTFSTCLYINLSGLKKILNWNSLRRMIITITIEVHIDRVKCVVRGKWNESILL